MAWNGSADKGEAASLRLNKKNSPLNKRQDAASPIKKGLLAGAIVVIGGGLAAWMMMRGERGERGETVEVKSFQIAEVKPQIATNAVAESPAIVPEPKKYRDAAGILRWESGARASDPTRPRKKPEKPFGSHERKIFKHLSERQLEHILCSRPGEYRPSLVDYRSKSFQRDMLAALDDPIEITDEDSEHDRRRKQAMIDVKKELKERVAAGENIGDILTEADRELKRLAEYSNELKKQVKTILSDDKHEYTDDDVKAVVAAANKMLESKGCNPISESQMTIWNLRMNAKRMGLSSEERAAAVKNYKEEVQLTHENKKEDMK